MTEETLYKVLGVETDASTQEIESAYRNLQKRWDTDAWRTQKKVALERGESSQIIEQLDYMIAQCIPKLEEINSAYLTLSNSNKRIQYDATLDRHKVSAHLPNISVSKTVLRFGKLRKGSGGRSEIFVISNQGDPELGDVSLDWENYVDWAVFEFSETENTLFPITVRVFIAI